MWKVAMPLSPADDARLSGLVVSIWDLEAWLGKPKSLCSEVLFVLFDTLELNYELIENMGLYWLVVEALTPLISFFITRFSITSRSVRLSFRKEIRVSWCLSRSWFFLT